MKQSISSDVDRYQRSVQKLKESKASPAWQSLAIMASEKLWQEARMSFDETAEKYWRLANSLLGWSEIINLILDGKIVSVQ